MTGWAAIIIGLLVGLVYAATKRIVATSALQISGGALLLKWPNGIGRSSVVEVKSNTIRLSPPIMRQDYAPPAPGSEVILKPLAGGPVRRGRFVAHGDGGWTVRLG